MKLVIKQAAGATTTIEVEPSMKVLEAKEVIAKECDVPANQQRLIYSGKVLKDPETLESYAVQDGHTVHMVKGPPPSSSPAASAPAATANPAANAVPGGGAAP